MKRRILLLTTLSLLTVLPVGLSACAGNPNADQLLGTSGNYFDRELTLEYEEWMTLQDRLEKLTPEDKELLLL